MYMKRTPRGLAVTEAGDPCNPVDGFFLYGHLFHMYKAVTMKKKIIIMELIYYM